MLDPPSGRHLPLLAPTLSHDQSHGCLSVSRSTAELHRRLSLHLAVKQVGDWHPHRHHTHRVRIHLDTVGQNAERKQGKHYCSLRAICVTASSDHKHTITQTQSYCSTQGWGGGVVCISAPSRSAVVAGTSEFVDLLVLVLLRT